MEHYFKKAQFVKSAVNKINYPEKRLNEVIFVGKSNVGKSSIINALVNMKNLAFTSSKPGHTRLLNFYLIEDNFYFVDFPGYGYSSKKDVDYKMYGDMIEEYFVDNKHLKLIVFLLDSRHEPTLDDLDFYKFLSSYDYKYVICMTKCDKLNQSERSKINKNVSNILGSAAIKNIIYTSVKDKDSIKLLKQKIIKEVY